MNDQTTPYDKEIKNNEQLFYTMLEKFRPDLFVLADLVDRYKFNPYILMKVIRHVLNIEQGTKWGQVIIVIKDGKVTIVQGTEHDRIDENIVER